VIAWLKNDGAGCQDAGESGAPGADVEGVGGAVGLFIRYMAQR